jgi:hypothetical protein
MDERLSAWIFRIYGDEIPPTIGIRSRDLEPLEAVGTSDEHRLSGTKVVEPLEEVNSAHRYPLHLAAVVARERDLAEPREHRQPGAHSRVGWNGAVGRLAISK